MTQGVHNFHMNRYSFTGKDPWPPGLDIYVQKNRSLLGNISVPLVSNNSRCGQVDVKIIDDFMRGWRRDTTTRHRVTKISMRYPPVLQIHLRPLWCGHSDANESRWLLRSVESFSGQAWISCGVRALFLRSSLRRLRCFVWSRCSRCRP